MLDRPVLAATAATALALLVARLAARRRAHTGTDDSMCDEVLDFWFNGDPAELYKSKWFVQHGSNAQAELDAIFDASAAQRSPSHCVGGA